MLIQQIRDVLEEITTSTRQEKLASYGTPPEVNDYTFKDPFAFLVGVLADYQVSAGRAWSLPFFLRRRLGVFTPQSIALLSVDELEQRLRSPKSLHRFPREMARNISAAAKMICTEFDGNAKNVWQTCSLAELQTRLRKFRGIGNRGSKKEPMMIKMLIRDWDLVPDDPYRVHIAYDELARRVLLRLGLMKKDSLSEIQRVGSLLNPIYPAKFDDAVWLVGRKYCHPEPECSACPLNKQCPKMSIMETRKLPRGTYN